MAGAAGAAGGTDGAGGVGSACFACAGRRRRERARAGRSGDREHGGRARPAAPGAGPAAVQLPPCQEQHQGRADELPEHAGAGQERGRVGRTIRAAGPARVQLLNTARWRENASSGEEEEDT